ncbi:MAG: hypothetical protein K6U03_10005 [Firmicutes bacterium]|nr:hypothetical protein [Bacillota bacterium]
MKMKKMLSIRTFALAAFLFAFGLAGCGGGGGGGGGGYDPTADKAAIREAIDRFVEGVQEYDVVKMTDRLSPTNFELTLREGGGTPYTKDYATLMSEVADPEEVPDQAYWREHYGYELVLTLANVAVNPSSTGTGSAEADFVVEESATGIPAQVTDTGHISWVFAKMNGAWLATAMEIAFAAGGSARALETDNPRFTNFFNICRHRP